jgi:hypothetical protein
MVGILRVQGFMVAALLAIVVGYLLLAAQRLTLGPVLLVLGYCVLFPVHLWRAFRRRATQAAPSSEDAGDGAKSG